mmetsp:Transcript_143670/g.364686  ORF Transcript_143670/g.364686 Transcript_143670/m.364686 type:complete len:925 (-) Transcript_143670:139-2913(-)
MGMKTYRSVATGAASLASSVQVAVRVPEEAVLLAWVVVMAGQAAEVHQVALAPVAAVLLLVVVSVVATPSQAVEAREAAAAAAVAVETESQLQFWDASVDTGQRLQLLWNESWRPKSDPALAVQAAIAKEEAEEMEAQDKDMASSADRDGDGDNGAGVGDGDDDDGDDDGNIARGGGGEATLLRAWSRVHRPLASNVGGLGLSWTAPIAYCGNYSCLDGVVGASVRLSDISFHCHELWKELQRTMLGQSPPVTLTTDNSSIFIVNQVSDYAPEQQGLLMAASSQEDLSSDGLPPNATNSSQGIIRAAARAVLAQFHSWDSRHLQEWANTSLPSHRRGETSLTSLEEAMRLFNFSRTRILQDPPDLRACQTVSENIPGFDIDCFQLGLLSMQLDAHTRWLVVLVLPAGVFGASAAATRKEVQDHLDNLELRLDQVVGNVRATGALLLFGVVSASIIVGLCLGALVSRPLRRLSVLMRRLGDLDFAHESAEFAELHPGRRSRIRDVRELQEAFRRLSRGTEAFARFVPETVVRNIIHGTDTAGPATPSLHVSRRRVTIMNSDIEGFTAISESLSQRDLLFVLTRYLSVMTRVVELYDGVVSEIQGDGLIVFWNTPDDVEDHASKACAAALAQQHAVGLLNAEFATLDLPHLSVRIGIHTGHVMSGNIGSESKMKFGCLGEPMQVAACLQEFCKPYGAQVICSADTYSEVEHGVGFFCRRLDLVRVKGSGEATWIFEVVGREGRNEHPDGGLETDIGEKNNKQRRVADTGIRANSLKSTSSVVSEAIRKSTSSLVSPSAPIWRPIQRWMWQREPETARCRNSVVTHDACRAPCATENYGKESCVSKYSIPQAEPPCPDVITADQRRHKQIYEEAIDAFHNNCFRRAQTLAETLLNEVDDSAAARLAELARRSLGSEDKPEYCPEDGC